MHNTIIKKIKDIVDNKFEGKTIIKSKVSIFPEEPSSCVEDNIFFIICQKNKVIKVKSKNIEELLNELFSMLEAATFDERIFVSSQAIDELLNKYNFTFSKDKFLAAVGNRLKDKIINNYIFGFDMEGNCIPIKKMWTNTVKRSLSNSPTVTLFAKRNSIYAKISGLKDINNLNKSKYKEEDNCIVCNYKNFIALNLKDFSLSEDSILAFNKVTTDGKEDYILKITKAIEEKMTNGVCNVEVASIQKR